MIKIFKDAFKITFTNSIMLTPLLLFLFILNIYLAVAKNAVNALPSAILFYVTLLLMISAFASGWLNMIKMAIYNYKNDVYSAEFDSFKLLNEFPSGIAEYIKSFLGFSLLYLLVADITFYSVYTIGLKCIGGVGVSLSQFMSASESSQTMSVLLNSLTKEQILKINYWYLLAVASVQIFALFTLFWPIEILYSTKNPIIAFLRSIKRIFTKPQIILLFILINVFNFILTVLNYLSMINPITYFIMTFVIFCFIMYIFVILFLYYEEKIQSNSNRGSDSNGQE